MIFRLTNRTWSANRVPSCGPYVLYVCAASETESRWAATYETNSLIWTCLAKSHCRVLYEKDAELGMTPGQVRVPFVLVD
jgi:hypothetical protein